MKISQQLGKRLAVARSSTRPEEISGKVRIITFDVLLTEPEKDFRIAMLPAGHGRLLTTLCRVAVVKGGVPVEATLSMGHEGYTTMTHTKVEPSSNALSTDVKVKGMASFGTVSNIAGFQYESMAEIAVTLTSPKPLDEGVEIHGTLFYVTD